MQLMNPSKKAIEFNITPKNNFTIGIDELWSYRELFVFFAWRDIKVKYKQTALGVLWAIIQPLALMVIFTLIFNKGLKVSSEGMPYPIFAFSGLLIWNIFSNGLLNSANSMINSANIIKKIYFPRLILPMSAILTAVFDFIFAFVVFIGLLLFYHQHIDLIHFLFYFPLSLLLIVITTFGLGALVASLNIKYRDFQYALPFTVQFLLFVNPVLYSSNTFKEKWMGTLMKINPIASSINLFRASFSNKNVVWSDIALGFLTAFIFLAIGIYSFRKTERYFADLA